MPYLSVPTRTFGRIPIWASSILLVAACVPERAPTAAGSAESAASPSPEAAAPAEQAPPPVDPAEIASRLAHGIDLSHHDGTVDWEDVAAAGHTFAIVKASEGVDAPDPAFPGHWPAMKAAGLIRGAYHFYVTEDDPAEQAKLFVDTVDLEPGDLAPAVDVEVIGHDTQPGLADRLKTFLSILEQHYGVKPIIYTGPNFWDANLDASFGDHPLWVAEYGVSEPRLPAGWQEWHLWQYDDDVTVPGVEKAVDASHVNRSGADLGALVIPD
jgi:lysozyme